jgi:hypothetical protein
MDYQNTIFRFLETYLVLDRRFFSESSDNIEHFIFTNGIFMYANHKLKTIHIHWKLIEKLQKVFTITDSDCVDSISGFFGCMFSIPMVEYSCVRMRSIDWL